MKLFAARLKAAREAAFLSQEELAEILDMSVSNVQRLERGEISGLMRNKVPKLAGAIRMSESVFMAEIAVPADYITPMLESPAPSFPVGDGENEGKPSPLRIMTQAEEFELYVRDKARTNPGMKIGKVMELYQDAAKHRSGRPRSQDDRPAE